MAGPETLPRLLTIDQLAEHLGTSHRHLRRLIAERRIPYVKVGRLIRFDPAEIAAWLDNHCSRDIGHRHGHERPSQPGLTIRRGVAGPPHGRPPSHGFR